MTLNPKWTQQSLCVLVIGDVMLDRYLVGRCDRVSPEAPVPVVDVRETRHHLGGAGNVVRNVQALCATPHLASVIGHDPAGAMVSRLLASCAADARGLITEEARRSTEKTRIIAVNQQVLRYDFELTEEISAKSEDAILDFVRQFSAIDAIIISDYGKGVVTERLCREVIRHGREKGAPVLCDPKGRNFAKYTGATVLTPNRKEAADATGISITNGETLRAAGERLRASLELDACLITLGEEGMALFSHEGMHQTTAHPREVYDVTGAGDTAVAALAVAMAAGNSLRDACEFANIAAGIKVSKFGAAPVSLREVQTELSTHGQRLDSNVKIKSAQEIREIAAELCSSGKRIVFTNGCFDILHRGHAQYLQSAASFGDALIVGLNTDRSVRRLKGAARPVQGEHDRAFILAALSCVDYVVLFDADTPIDLIAAVEPDVLVKGGDYTVNQIVGADLVRDRGGEVHTVPLIEGLSTSQILQRLLVGQGSR